MKLKRLIPLALLLAAGCTSYRWTSRVPEELRTVAVPIFENRSMNAELGPITTQYVLREFQREGTFKIRRAGDSAIEVQGVIVSANREATTYDRTYDNRGRDFRLHVVAEVSIVNKDTGKVLQDARRYEAETSFLALGDPLTGQRNAAPRIAADLARQIVDDVVSWPYNRPAARPDRAEGVRK